ncbi:uncharacterized protein PgNI_09380 [Pyricularia grisea]|uniref:Uncharacterized protein n=1 Tax=Pyricularia grisea TaxID=148305 RepID=A0A6P8AT40_PYRGI|nr:uncharacterized protein PgNI_09380 [Pyricularia grisea]TLD05285.1 hypothetical protein PgNI_09380 [Pyricularia grisea]
MNNSAKHDADARVPSPAHLAAVFNLFGGSTMALRGKQRTFLSKHVLFLILSRISLLPFTTIQRRTDPYIYSMFVLPAT